MIYNECPTIPSIWKRDKGKNAQKLLKTHNNLKRNSYSLFESERYSCSRRRHQRNRDIADACYGFHCCFCRRRTCEHWSWWHNTPLTEHNRWLRFERQLSRQFTNSTSWAFFTFCSFFTKNWEYYIKAHKPLCAV